MSDLIDRQAAIEIIQSMYPGMPRVPWMRKDWQKRYEPYIRTEKAIRDLPSVQSEIIMCKDCIHFHHNFPYIIQGFPVFMHEICDFWGEGCKTSKNAYCSHAERESNGN